jgi:glycerol-3-phosphate dehydrogenase (NAD(P)+)
VSGTLAICGAGSWGSALAKLWCDADRSVRIWARRPQQRDDLRLGRNPGYLPGVAMPTGLEVIGETEKLIDGAGALIVALPTAALDWALQTWGREAREKSIPVVLLAKGFDKRSGRRLSEVATEVLGADLVHVLLGPSHAEEVAREMPTAVVLAGGSEKSRSRLQCALSTSCFRVYTNHDLVGVEVAAALKNVLAIAAGICDGLGLGDNTKGALLTRGVVEISRLGEAMGGCHHTFYGLSGIGDVITTCLSAHSRNRALGEAVGRGASVEEALARVGQVVEGVATTQTLEELARRHSLRLPILEEVAEVLFAAKEPRLAIEELMLRELTSERGGDADLGSEGGLDVRSTR